MTTTSTIIDYQNGNAQICLEADGTRTISYAGELELDWPLNIDIRVSNRCSNGLNPKTGKARCVFCHESATTDGADANYKELLEILKPLPSGVELAIGSNRMTYKLFEFIWQCDFRGWIVNLTINQDHVNRDGPQLEELIDNAAIHGLGISYRSDFKKRHDAPFSRLPKLIKYPNTVIHVIEGIDDFESVLKLSELGVRKLLVLGEKDFGFNLGKRTDSPSHFYWLRNIHRLFECFEIVSFDNLAIERLDIQRFFHRESWNQFHQGEHSFYINSVDGSFSPHSRSNLKTNWHTVSIQDYFKRGRHQTFV